MKAVIEFDAPRTCMSCPLGHEVFAQAMRVCAGVKPPKIYKSVVTQTKRPEDCPLKIVDKESEYAGN